MSLCLDMNIAPFEEWLNHCFYILDLELDCADLINSVSARNYLGLVIEEIYWGMSFVILERLLLFTR